MPSPQDPVSSELQAHLQAALGDAYRIERELTRGGMSRVFVATETGLGRTVVLKILPPDLVAGLSVERFRREIQVAASLQHPHIVPLLSAGQAGDFLYYSMPYVEGESLRALLERQGELPVASAVRVATEVARALAYAHRHGIVHRDIKPDNILLAGDEAQVADFGIAKAVSLSAEKGGLTSIGLALGTPLYMAPEQAAADPATDHRADLYALGVVTYEMLAGQPPFGGRTPQQILGAHATETPAPLRTRRPAVPEPVADVVHRLLEKRPADRPQSAEEVIRLFDAAVTSAHPTTPIAIRRQSARRGRWLVAGGITALALAVTIAALTNRGRPTTVDQSVVAVAPFRVSGADSSLAYLREGMVDLLAAKLTGAGGIRAADPRAFLAGWRRRAGGSGDLPGSDAAGVAASVGAGRLIQGDVVGTPRQITINATMLDAPGSRVRARTTVEGSPDSLPRLVDGLAARLLALEAGEDEQRLANLTSTSLPALRAYLDGQALVRRGSFPEAAERFKLALQHDSTFALAGLGLSRAVSWFGGGTQGPGSQLAWRYRDKLSPRDRALLVVYLGPRWPAQSPLKEVVQAGERLVQVAPDNPEAWQVLGDQLYHFGPRVGIPDALRRASAAFGRAIALDSSFVPALEHGVTLGLALEDTSAARDALRRMLLVDSTSAWAAAQRWQLAAALGDTTSSRTALESDSLVILGALVQGAAMSNGLPLNALDSALRRARGRAVGEEQARLDLWLHLNSIISGQPSRAVPWPEWEWAPGIEIRRHSEHFLEARFANGDSVLGAAAATALDRLAGTPASREHIALMHYIAGQRALDLGRWGRAQQAVSDLRRPVPSDSGWLAATPTAYALVLEAQMAVRRHSPDEARLVAQLDSAMTNTASMGTLADIGNLLLARLHEERGDLPRALAAVRRRVFDYWPDPVYVTYYREEGRLAALNGDREGAIRAYRRYLALRSRAEPRLQPQVAQVRADLEALERESTDR
jgi:tetratricopeptide (TPR) repeat protein